MKKCLSIILALMLLTSIFITTGCKSSKDEMDENHYVKVEETDIYLYKAGRSDYKIVLPENPTTVEQEAAEELVKYMKESTGYTFAVISDSGLTYNEEDKYLSLGQNSLYLTSGLTFDEDRYGSDGYEIVKKGNTVFMTGSKSVFGYGTLYSVYDFLAYHVGYKFYTIDEINLEKHTSIKLKDLEIREVPSIENRSLGIERVINDKSVRNGLRLKTPYDNEWIIFGHGNETHILPTATYYEAHPDWYGPPSSNGKRQLCFTNEEMRAEYVKRVKWYIDEFPNGKYIEFGQNDGMQFCQCKNCVELTQKYDGAISGVQLEFANKVVDELNAYTAEKYPGRELVYMTFAYQTTERPPVFYDEENDKYVPMSEDCVPHENLTVMVAPCTVKAGYPYDHEKNISSYEFLRGWSAICKDGLFMWAYDFYDYENFIAYDAFGGIKRTYEIYEEHNVVYLYEEGAYNRRRIGFELMRAFVRAKMMWNVNLSVDDLVNEFMDAYYKEAKQEMREYYDLLQTWQVTLRDKYGIAGCVTDYPMQKQEYWPSELVNRFESVFKKAYSKIEPLKEADPEKYETIFNRVKEEELMTVYIQMTFYRGHYSKAELIRKIDDFEKYTSLFEMTNYKGAGVTADLIAEWRSKI